MDPAYNVPCVVAICICYCLTSLGISSFKKRSGYTPWVHESSLATFLGLLLGGTFKYTTGQAIQFDSNIFFYLVLPPIIFSAGISLDKDSFYRYIGTYGIDTIPVLFRCLNPTRGGTVLTISSFMQIIAPHEPFQQAS